MAGEAWRLGPADAVRSYLDVERVIAAAKAAGADAVHPGYGFLSEKATDSSPRTPRAMKMELSVEAPRAGVVETITVSEGGQVAEGAVLVTFADVRADEGTGDPPE